MVTNLRRMDSFCLSMRSSEERRSVRRPLLFGMVRGLVEVRLPGVDLRGNGDFGDPGDADDPGDARDLGDSCGESTTESRLFPALPPTS